MPVCMVLVELAIHDYMVVIVKVTKIYGKMNFNRWAPRNYSCTNNSHIKISENWLRMSAVINIYKARAWRNGYRMFISVYILCYMFMVCTHLVQCIKNVQS